MNEPVDSTIARRLERLEREQRWWRCVASSLVVGVAALALVGWKPGLKTVEADRFVVRDAAGRVRVELGSDGEQSFALRFKDAENVPRLSLGLESGAALLVLNEQHGYVRASLVTLPHGAPALTFYDANSKRRAELGVSREGSPALTLSDRDGVQAWKTP